MTPTAVRQDSSFKTDPRLAAVREGLRKILHGKPELVDKAIACFLGGGHLLLEGPPGTGKTSLAKGMAQLMDGVFHRIQMTSDLLPSDVIGTLRLSGKDQSQLEFKPGPVFANFLLADELNRTTPKTQGALLEAMEEGTVTVDGTTHALPQPFFVVATQNPGEFHGVYPFAEAQLDRFMMRLSFSAPVEEDEYHIYRTGAAAPQAALAAAELRNVMSLGDARDLRRACAEVHVEESVLRYVTQVVRETRAIPGVTHGVSVRGGIQFIAAAKALAHLRGRQFVLPEDVRDLAPECLAHRLTFPGGEVATPVRHQMIQDVLERVPAPR